MKQLIDDLNAGYINTCFIDLFKMEKDAERQEEIDYNLALLAAERCFSRQTMVIATRVSIKSVQLAQRRISRGNRKC